MPVKSLIFAATLCAVAALSQGGNRQAGAATCTSNDDFDCATVVTALPFDAQMNTANATSPADDPAPSLPPCSVGAGNFGHTVWYRYAPARDEVLSLSTLGSTYDTVLTVFTGNPGSFVEIACNDNYQGDPSSSIALHAQGGVTYHVMAAGFGPDNAGDLTFSIDVRCYKLTLQANPPGGGNPSSDPSSVGAPECTETGEYAPGSSAAVVPGGLPFYGWTGDDDCADGMLTFDSSKVCIANFTPTPAPTLPPTATPTSTPTPTPTPSPTLSLIHI